MKCIGIKFALTLILHSFFFSVIVLGNPTEATKKTAKIRGQLMSFGVGENAKIEVKLKNGPKVRGYVQEVRETDFTVIDETNNSGVTIPYPQVQKAKGQNLNTGTRILIGVGIFLVVVIILAVAAGNS